MTRPVHGRSSQRATSFPGGRARRGQSRAFLILGLVSILTSCQPESGELRESLFLATVAVDTNQAAVTGRQIIWTAGMETGDLSEWADPGGRDSGGGEFNSGGGDSWASREVAHGGEWSAKMVLSDGVGGTRLFRWRESNARKEAYYSAWFYFPQRYVRDEWWNIFQFKSQLSDTRNDPFWIIGVENRTDGAMYLALRDWIGEETFGQDAVDLPVGQWVRLECYLRQSAIRDGQLKCWQDDLLLWDLDMITTHYPDATNQWSINDYSSGVSPTPAVIYTDDASISIDPPAL